MPGFNRVVRGGFNMLKKAMSSIKEFHMLSRGDSVLVALSGGADSVALLRFLVSVREKYGLRLTAVHVNHLLRGSESDADELFCENLCESMGVPLRSFRCDVTGAKKDRGIGLEEAGRLVRYGKLYEVLNEISGDKIAVAHNMNDQSETLIMRLCRGTGLKGLGGIPPVRGVIIRPLIKCTRSEIELYLREIGQEYREDATNYEDVYIRNKIRLKVLPLLSGEVNEKALENIAKTASLLREDSGYLDLLAEKAFKSAFLSKDENRLSLDIKSLENLPDPVLSRVLQLSFGEAAGTVRDFELKHIKSIKSLLSKPTGKSISLPWGAGCRVVYGSLEFYNAQSAGAKAYETFCRAAKYSLKKRGYMSERF